VRVPGFGDRHPGVDLFLLFQVEVHAQLALEMALA
jgi:hypothetical protein